MYKQSLDQCNDNKLLYNSLSHLMPDRFFYFEEAKMVLVYLIAGLVTSERFNFEIIPVD